MPVYRKTYAKPRVRAGGGCGAYPAYTPRLGAVFNPQARPAQGQLQRDTRQPCQASTSG